MDNEHAVENLQALIEGIFGSGYNVTVEKDLYGLRAIVEHEFTGKKTRSGNFEVSDMMKKSDWRWLGVLITALMGGMERELNETF